MNIKTLIKPTPFKIGCLLVLLSIILCINYADRKPAFLKSLDNQIIDAMFRFRGPVQTTGSVVIIDIDEKSLREVGQWPWSRKTVAELVKNVHNANARVLGFDIVFAEKDRTSPSNLLNELENETRSIFSPALFKSLEDMDYDIMLGDVVAESPTVLGYAFQIMNDGLKTEHDRPFPSMIIEIHPNTFTYDAISLKPAYRAVTNVEDIAQAETEGFFNVFPDHSGIVRKVPLFMEMDGLAYPSLALEMLRVGKKETSATIHVSRKKRGDKNDIFAVSIKDRQIRTDDYGQLTINFRGPVYTFEYLSAIDLLKGNFKDKLRDKYALVGTSAAGLLDLRATPYSAIFPGVEIQATIIDNILKEDFFTYDIPTENLITIVIVLIFGLLLSASLSFARPLTGGLLAVLFFLIMIAGNYYLFFLKNQIIGLSYPILTIFSIFTIVTLFNYFFEGREKYFIHNAFGRYVSHHVVNQLVKSPEKLSLAGEQKCLSIFFSDIRDFTTISEQMNSKDLGRVLNEYLTAMSDIIMDHNGMVDKYIGDAIMAIWGAPLEDEDHAVNAMKASLKMLETLKELQHKWEKQNLPFVDIGIGINTGIVSVGNFGSKRRFDYTVIGDNVNLASRLEGLTKMYGIQILISEFTREALGDAFFYRKIDMVRVKGKSQAVGIYEPICEGTPDTKLGEDVIRFEAALSDYFNKNFERAYAEISELYEKKRIKLYEIYLQRIKTYLKTPPPDDWDGTFVFNTK